MKTLDAIKDIVVFIQKTDNIEMVNKIIDIQSIIIEMQNELLSLREENDFLKKNKAMEEQIIRYPNDTVVALKGKAEIKFCSRCWDDERKLIQVWKDETYYKCPKCKNADYFYGTILKENYDD